MPPDSIRFWSQLLPQTNQGLYLYLITATCQPLICFLHGGTQAQMPTHSRVNSPYNHSSPFLLLQPTTPGASLHFSNDGLYPASASVVQTTTTESLFSGRGGRRHSNTFRGANRERRLAPVPVRHFSYYPDGPVRTAAMFRVTSAARDVSRAAIQACSLHRTSIPTHRDDTPRQQTQSGPRRAAPTLPRNVFSSSKHSKAKYISMHPFPSY